MVTVDARKALKSKGKRNIDLPALLSTPASSAMDY
jgi:hypothetical protein